MSARVSCVGVAVLDLIYNVERLPVSDDKIVAHSLVESGGGMAANAAAAIARLGGQAAWYGRVGDDALGGDVLSGLAAAGVEVGGARSIPGAQTSHSIVLVDDNGDRVIILFGSDGMPNEAAWLDCGAVTAGDAVLADIRWIDGAVKALTAARMAGIPAIFDADVSKHPGALSAVRSASHAVFSAPGLAGLFDTDDPVEGLRRAASCAPFVAVTLGANGVKWLDGSGAVQAIPSFPVVARETLGAGDVFHGAFALALAEGRNENDSLRFAAAAAAVKCARSGGRATFPTRDEVDKCLMQTF